MFKICIQRYNCNEQKKDKSKTLKGKKTSVLNQIKLEKASEQNKSAEVSRHDII